MDKGSFGFVVFFTLYSMFGFSLLDDKKIKNHLTF